MTLQQLRYVVMIADKKSMNKAASELFITQPSLSNTIKDLEEEIGITLFNRTNRGILLTVEGQEFLGYARQMLEHYKLIEERFVLKQETRKRFSVSMQHYTFAVQAFMTMANEVGLAEYEFAIHETKTKEVIDNVKNQKSELGILYVNDFNKNIMDKVFRDSDLEFLELFKCNIYAYMSKNNPLARQKQVSIDELQEYPCLSFEQSDNNSFYFAEEVLSTHEYKKIIKVNDRATMLNLMVGMNGYTLCSGIICEDLNGDDYIAIPLDTSETMTIGYVKKKRMPISVLGERYIKELKQYENKVMKR